MINKEFEGEVSFSDERSFALFIVKKRIFTPSAKNTLI